MPSPAINPQGRPIGGEEMKKESALSLLLLTLIMLSTMTLQVSATDYTKAGVKVGDTADYTYSNSFSTPTATGRFHIQILEIAGFYVRLNSRELYLNNSEGPALLLAGNVSADDSETFPYLVVANLSQGDNLVREDDARFQWWPIDNTTIMIAAGQNRTVNHTKFTGQEHLPTNVIYYSNEAYYDKITGLLIASIITDTNQDGTKHTWTQILNSTTAFTGLNSTGQTILPPEETTAAPPNPNIAATIAFTAITAPLAIALVAAAAITQHRKPKTTTH